MRRLLFEAVSESEEQTLDLGRRLGAALRTGTVVGLTGPLGAGKTRMIQGIARGAGYAGRVRSPTFALLHLYRGPVPLRHFDFYRLEGIDAGTAGEWEEEMEQEGLSLVEWADRLPDLLPEGAIWIELLPERETRRRITLRGRLPGRELGDWKLRG
ncbi:MAG: tRNA (adenosine(37)-N6)-threonylcarbamoyltransferase complex ATPase subunit type 1 TsaE [Candidatus Eisenbacteria bacterium]|nr:tRNA (adenosine(37)-N6)-threonylcarbamoyltransferase complex ATPase subunit type 1 TsaE [Candidatus Latescibacterota bacterium]MBD3301570.1 tRNA (adenosine(37)-N6)-threonylcarbamoyltransferase complex ATPase subunit type 1 TsaE [Candidatus Eisenbacteria bacterium]